MLPFKPNGKAQHIKGFLRQFRSTAANTAGFLTQVADRNIPLVGEDPALVLCYRDEYVEILGKDRGEFSVLTVHEWLKPRLSQFTPQATDAQPWYLLAHCTEKTKLPNAEKSWWKSSATLVRSSMRLRKGAVVWRVPFFMRWIN